LQIGLTITAFVVKEFPMVPWLNIIENLAAISYGAKGLSDSLLRNRCLVVTLDCLEQLTNVISKGPPREAFQKVKTKGNKRNKFQCCPGIFQYFTWMWSFFTQTILDTLSAFSSGSVTQDKVNTEQELSIKR
jgi:hypothetical protein